MPTKMPIGTHTPADPHTHAHPHTHTRTYEQGKRTRSTPTSASPSRHNTPYQSPPQTLRIITRPTIPNPHSPRPQTSLLPRVLSPPDQSSAPLFFLSHSSTSLRLFLAPRVADFNSVLPRTWARNRVPPKRWRAPPDGHNSRTYDWRGASVLGLRASKLAPFPCKFFESPQEVTQ
jgi:hypothetical protein